MKWKVKWKITFGGRQLTKGVSKIPGATATNRIPSSAKSRAKGSVILAIAPFDAEYADCNKTTDNNQWIMFQRVKSWKIKEKI